MRPRILRLPKWHWLKQKDIGAPYICAPTSFN